MPEQRPSGKAGPRPTDLRGCANELRAAAAFLLCGWEVFWPASYSSPVDFMAVQEEVAARVQVKSAHTTPAGTFRVHTAAHKYGPASFDILVAVCPDGSVWSAHWKTTYKRKTLTLKADMHQML